MGSPANLSQVSKSSVFRCTLARPDCLPLDGLDLFFFFDTMAKGLGKGGDAYTLQLRLSRPDLED